MVSKQNIEMMSIVNKYIYSFDIFPDYTIFRFFLVYVIVSLPDIHLACSFFFVSTSNINSRQHSVKL